jgi:hypothetical protein
VASLIVALSLCGCGRTETGPARIAVYGKVAGPGTVNGTISFLPAGETKGPSATASIANGSYRFDTTDGPVAGSYNVVITLRREVPKAQAGLADRPIKSPADQAPPESAQQPQTACVTETTKQLDFEVK